MHAAHFLANRIAQVRHAAGDLPVPSSWRPTMPSCSVTGGSKGLAFSRDSFRRLHKAEPTVKRRSKRRPSRGYLERHPVMMRATPAASSWGAGGYGEVWIGPNPRSSGVTSTTRPVRGVAPRRHRSVTGQGARARPDDRELLLAPVERLGFHHRQQDRRTLRVGADSCARARLRHLGRLIQKASLERAMSGVRRRRRVARQLLADLASESLRSAYE